LGVMYRIPVGWSAEPGQIAASLLPAFGGLVSRPPRNRSVQRELARLVAARQAVAKLVVADPVYVPIFERIEAEIASEAAKLIEANPLASARAIVAARRVS
jgi:hypothetical protein